MGHRKWTALAIFFRASRTCTSFIYSFFLFIISLFILEKKERNSFFFLSTFANLTILSLTESSIRSFPFFGKRRERGTLPLEVEIKPAKYGSLKQESKNFLSKAILHRFSFFPYFNPLHSQNEKK